MDDSKLKREDYASIGFVLVLVGGILFLILGITGFSFLIYDMAQVGFVNGDPDLKVDFFWRLGFAFALVLANIWILASAFWIKKNKSSGGSVTALILGLLFLPFVSKRHPFAFAAVFPVLADKNRSCRDKQPVDARWALIQ